MILKLKNKDIELTDIWFKYLYPSLVRFSITKNISIEWKNELIEIPEQHTKALIMLLEKNLIELLNECYTIPTQKQRSKNSSRYKKINFEKKEYVVNYRTDVVGIVCYGLNYLIEEIKN